MRILLTNDDGYKARGLQALRKSLLKSPAVSEVVVVAPQGERSTTGHSLTLSTALKLEDKGEQVYACSGFPADCVVLACLKLFRSKSFDLVISGINRGANMGQDIFLSGTVAGARQACIQKIPSIAVSLVLDDHCPERPMHFEAAAESLARLVEGRVFDRVPENCFLNINYPNLPCEEMREPKVTDLGLRHYADEVIQFENEGSEAVYQIGGQFEPRDHVEGTDGEAVAQGHVSLSLLNILPENSRDNGIFERSLAETELV